jgi:glutamate-5-semialdehyde dehydrogenase
MKDEKRERDMDIGAYVDDIGRRARAASRALGVVPTDVKNRALLCMARAVEEEKEKIMAANREDLESARRAGLSEPIIQRLKVSDKTIGEICAGLRQVAELPDPVGEVLGEWQRPNGLTISKVRVPIGVILMIYEARPNVTPDAGALCMKAGNAVILRGGREAVNSNRALAAVLRRAAGESGIPEDALQLVDRMEHSVVDELLKCVDYIDLVIPRGGEALIRKVTELSSIPVIKHYKGVCKVYVDKDADLAMAERIIKNAKLQKPAVCNAAETLLVHRAVAKRFIPGIVKVLKDSGVEIRGDEQTRALAPEVAVAHEDDWSREYLDLILAVKVVRDIDEAIEHINSYGSQHSDAIVTADEAAAEKFLRAVDSSAVFWNASTRFNDGGQFGMGAEIGISTDRIHARGPMALPELTIYKYVVRGSGQVRE